MTLLTILIIALSFFIQSLMGFGGGFVSIPLLLLFMPVQDGVTLVMFFQFFMAVLLFRLYRQVAWKTLLKFAPGVFIGTVVGLYSLAHFNDDVIRVLLSLFIIFYIMQKYLEWGSFSYFIRKAGAPATGVVSGWISGLIGMGSPLYVAYFRENTPDKDTFRASMVAALFCSNVVRVPFSFNLGFVSHEMLMLVLYCLPGFIAALWFGDKIHSHIPEPIFFRFVTGLLILTAFLLLMKAVF